MAKAHQHPRVRRYSGQFKLTAVRLSNTPGVQVKDVAEALDIHPFMLSKWRKEAREGAIEPDSPKPPAKVKVVKERVKTVRVVQPPSAATQRDLKRYAELKQEHALLLREHELLKKVIRFCSNQSATSSRSLIRNGTDSTLAGSANASASAAPGTTPGAAVRRRAELKRTRR